ncbi:hypothetical protein GQ457_06G015920 [Hibiscus cannabinus]
MHWQGVWQSFDCHGEVVDVFISRRRNRKGERFGFVRMAMRAAAKRVIERLNGFWLDQRQGSNHSVSGGQGGVYRRVTRVLDGSKSYVLETCAVAWCKGRLWGEVLVKELQQAGFTGCSVMQVASEVVLLLFVTEERKTVLDRSYLDKWFVKVLPWSPDIVFDSRSAWVSVFGVPVQFWSQDTFVNITQLWGSLVRLDENTVEPKSFEQARFLIETKHWDRIAKTVEVDCNGRLVPIRVHEVEVVHTHDIVCQCETEDASSENTDQVEGVREVSQDSPVELDAARILPGQVVMRATDSGWQDNHPDERGVTVWIEETTLAVSGVALALATTAVGERGTKVVFEAELDSTLYKDMTIFSNSNLVGDENLTHVPIEVTDLSRSSRSAAN